MSANKQWHRGDWMLTFTGKKFYPLSPRVEDIDIIDIAHSLSLQCRYNGHVQRFYSVAEHCVLMSRAISRGAAESWVGLPPSERAEMALWALLHDAPEAYIGDMVRPLKRHMPDYCAIDDAIMKVIAERFELEARTIPPMVKGADTRILLDERDALFDSIGGDWGLGDILPLGVQVEGLSPEAAEFSYLTEFRHLMGLRQ